MNTKNIQANQKEKLKTALVTGGARRIGAEIVKMLHKNGYRVVIHCHQSLKTAQTLADELNNKTTDSALVIQKDLQSYTNLDVLIKQVIAWSGNLHLLVNNASLFMPTFSSIPCEAIADIEQENSCETLFNINVFAPWYLSMSARPWLEKVHGSIINITDIHAERPLKNYALYCQSKAALWMQTKTLAIEFAPKIRVNAIAPGAIIWPEKKNSLAKEIKFKIIKETPLKRHGRPIYIAEAVIALLKNDFITGQVLRIDGGRIIQ